MTSTEKTIEIEVLRYRPEQDDKPYLQSFKVPFTDDMSVLQGVQYIKDYMDGSLSFRWSCRMAICGSCGMMINGIPKLSCKTFLREYYPGKLTVEALKHFPIEKDLIIDLSDFIEKLESIKPYIIPVAPRTLEQGEYLQTPRQLEKIEQFSSCINCLLCYAACPQYGLKPEFTGPGALALLHRYNEDNRDGGKAERMEIINSEAGVWACTLVGYCSDVCPKGVDPSAAINRNKLNSTMDYFLRFVAPRGGSN
jgi:fumarate reductase iron-sulfur subunit